MCFILCINLEELVLLVFNYFNGCYVAQDIPNMDNVKPEQSNSKNDCRNPQNEHLKGFNWSKKKVGIEKEFLDQLTKNLIFGEHIVYYPWCNRSKYKNRQ